MQTILAPPFAWRWNRVGASPTVPTFTTVAGQSDYSVSLPSFGWIEKATAYDLSNGNSAYELQVYLNKSADPLSNQPTSISAQYDDDSGNITFRVFPTPDAVYSVVVEYQKSAPQFSSLTQTWSPLPDYMSYIFNEGYMAKAYDYFSDPRYMGSMQMFLTNLAAASENLNETEKNIWLENRLNSMRQTAAVQSGRR